LSLIWKRKRRGLSQKKLDELERQIRADQSRAPFAFASADAMRLAANVLSQAGVSGHRFLNPTEAKVPDRQVVWVLPNGIIGGFKGLRNAARIRLEDAAAQAIAANMKGCMGDSASGKKRANTLGGGEMLKFFIACRDPSLEIHYTMVKTPQGALLTFAHFSRAGSGTGAVMQADDVLTRNANFALPQ